MECKSFSCLYVKANPHWKYEKRLIYKYILQSSGIPSSESTSQHVLSTKLKYLPYSSFILVSVELCEFIFLKAALVSRFQYPSTFPTLMCNLCKIYQTVLGFIEPKKSI